MKIFFILILVLILGLSISESHAFEESNKKYGLETKEIVCGNRLCSDLDPCLSNEQIQKITQYHQYFPLYIPKGFVHQCANAENYQAYFTYWKNPTRKLLYEYKGTVDETAIIMNVTEKSFGEFHRDYSSMTYNSTGFIKSTVVDFKTYFIQGCKSCLNEITENPVINLKKLNERFPSAVLFYQNSTEYKFEGFFPLGELEKIAKSVQNQIHFEKHFSIGSEITVNEWKIFSNNKQILQKYPIDLKINRDMTYRMIYDNGCDFSGKYVFQDREVKTITFYLPQLECTFRGMGGVWHLPVEVINGDMILGHATYSPIQNISNKK